MAFRPKKNSAKGFTLVELLVVIGIIALLIGILLPVLSRARGSANQVSDQANLRSLGQGFIMYSQENDNSAPYGIAAGVYNSATGQYDIVPDPTGDWYLIHTWATQINHMLAETQDNEIWPTDDASNPWTQQVRNPLQPFLRSPGVDGGLNSILTYTVNPNVMTSPGPLNYFSSNPLARGEWGPAKLNRLYPDNVVIYDTAARPADHEMDMVAYDAISGIDDLRYWADVYGRGTNPYYRYRDDSQADPFVGSLLYGNDRSIILRALTSDGGAYTYSNDKDGPLQYGNDYGPARFRYGDNNVCNVTFADGSVRAISKGRVAGNGLWDTEFKRAYMKPKFPQGPVGPRSSN